MGLPWSLPQLLCSWTPLGTPLHTPRHVPLVAHLLQNSARTNSQNDHLCTVMYCKLWTQAIASKSTSKLSYFFYTTNRLPVPLVNTIIIQKYAHHYICYKYKCNNEVNFFTFVPNWRCFELSSEDSVSTFFGCFCFWSWWLWATFINRILSLQFYLVSSSSAAPSPGPQPCFCNRETLITDMATQTPFPKGCLSSLQNT